MVKGIININNIISYGNQQIIVEVEIRLWAFDSLKLYTRKTAESDLTNAHMYFYDVFIASK